jgi:predicted nucleic acid-binding protein
VTGRALRDLIGDGDRLVVDTSIVIAYLKGDEPISEAAALVFDELVATERNPATLSTVSVAEALVSPINTGGRALSAIRTFLLAFPGLAIRSVDFLVAAEAARLRAATGITTPDALIAASATLTSSRWLITNDRILRDRLTKIKWPVQVLVLGEPVVRPAASR